MRLSAGTAKVMGLNRIKADSLPTTAYIMVGESCRRGCSFCTQSIRSDSRRDYLSRVTWPEFDDEIAVAGLAEACRRGSLKRACLQVVDSRESMEAAIETIKKLKGAGDIPINASVYITSPEEAEALFGLGIDTISLPIDVASRELYSRIKGGSLDRLLDMIYGLAERYPGRVNTHLIAGLGETEEEMIRLIYELHNHGVSTALFAFTPVRGTPMEDKSQPPLDSYRRIQLARYLIINNLVSIDDFIFVDEELKDVRGSDILLKRVKDGNAFMTSGCQDCNRPYYNERPGGVMYNYPRPLTEEEAEKALRETGIFG
ncbi:MAG: radical SAM protein [Thermoanaerobacteraceae bacterium]|nr:radical SAM protein [Thermoanaerobacteraceae bacterium]